MSARRLRIASETGIVISASPASLLARQSTPVTDVLPPMPAVLKFTDTFWTPPAEATEPDVADVPTHGRSLGVAQSETASVIVQFSGSSTSGAVFPITSVSEVVCPSSSVFE